MRTQLEIYENALENLEETRRLLGADIRAMYSDDNIKAGIKKVRELNRKIDWLKGEIEKLQKGV